MKNIRQFISLETSEQKLTELDKMLIKAFFDEKTAEFQYLMASHEARGAGRADAVDEYARHEDEEHGHAAGILKRLEQRGIIVRVNLGQLAKNGNPWTPVLVSDVKEQYGILIKAEETARDYYGRIAVEARNAGDLITEQLAKEYMADEEEHLTDLKRLSEELI